jgi:hypothetical protein
MNRIKYYFIGIGVVLIYTTQSCFQFNKPITEKKVPDSISYNFNIRPILSDKCFVCHGPDGNKRQADLRLDIPENAYKVLKGTTTAHALTPGDPLTSEVYLRISSEDSSEQMPPPSSNLTLSVYEIALIKKWISQGARYEKHWAFVPAADQPLPVLNTDKQWPRNEIDFFVLHKMQEERLHPNPESGKERLLKHVCLDLTGLPPDEKLMNDFQNDSTPGAYEKIIDRLLQDSSYGERMALNWMDVARYADSYGYQDDYYRSQWPWRDWIIHAFNNNMPYDEFVKWQIAGDLLPEHTKEQLLATAFNRNHKITEEGGVIDEEYRVDYVTDRTNTFGRAFLGITIECAHCHDHKYDPFTQKEHYQLFSFFNNVKETGLEAGYKPAKNPVLEITKKDTKELMTYINNPDTGNVMVSVMGDRDTLRPTFILKRGSYDAHGDEVFPGTPASILPFANNYPRNRLGLAEWLFDKKNPLTARVYVNRVWQQLFGRGIVRTSGDFGMQGELPSHPALLDWLAVDFETHGWNIKRLVRQIVTSSTYRQSTAVTSEQLKTDPENIYLSRAPRLRLEAEFVRDLVLSSSGLLVRKIGGPSVKPYQPKGLWEAAVSTGGMLSTIGTYKQDHGESLYRRGLYTFIKRTVPPPVMGIFDASNRDQCEIKRSATNTPLQALVMMNDPTVLEASRVLACKLLSEHTSLEDKVNKAFRFIVCRRPYKKETELLMNSYHFNLISVNKQSAQKLLSAGEFPLPDKVDVVPLASLMQVVSAIYNLEESITKS